jgi:2-amino-4-hydroxy-6-hydroxymethyldihydropteridine diphosphokinase
VILIGLGGNLESVHYGAPRQTLAAALAALAGEGVRVVGRSGWYRSAPVPVSGQPWFVNAVAAIATRLGPFALLDRLQALEARFGRVRGARNAARILDLDLLDYCGRRIATPRLTLPHPRMTERRFVLLPLVELAPGWRHPVSGMTAAQLLSRLPEGQRVARLAG